MDMKQTESNKAGAGALDAVLRVVAAVCLAVTLVAAGLFACAGPRLSTQCLASAFSNDQDSPFTKDELVAAAVAARDYTVADNNLSNLQSAIAQINVSAAQDGRTKVGAPDMAQVPNADGLYDQNALESVLTEASEQYVLTPDAVSHLDDVFTVVQVARAWLFGAFIAACVACVAVAARRGLAALAPVLSAAGAAVLGAFAVLAAWVALDFNGFFAAFHSLFFAAGTWTFSWDSLLICMYPPEFWIGMGVIWLAVTVAGCATCLIMGNLLRKRAKTAH